MVALYNEIDPFAADWISNLVTAGHVVPGAIDARSITELVAEDVHEATQAHFFAGIAVWSAALRAAGWPDDLPVWTGSCPCQPFSQAGRGKGTADQRHLWPEWFRLIRECKPPVVFGEQVASPAGLGWLDAVFADLEGAGYACAAADLCAASVGAPHIRQRLYFVAIARDERLEGDRLRLRERRSQQDLLEVRRSGEARELGVAGGTRSGRNAGAISCAQGESESERIGVGNLANKPQSASATRGVADNAGDRRQERRDSRSDHRTGSIDDRALGNAERNDGPGRIGATYGQPSIEPHRSCTTGFWSPADWIACRDGKARPVEPGTFPLAHGAIARVGRLRAYGNAIVRPQAQAFIEAVIEMVVASGEPGGSL